uniref:Uncharacterized protein n=1 Tax=Panagrolaimus davidi TaxID=227884 RepID=A0A914PBD9_9BILA
MSNKTNQILTGAAFGFGTIGIVAILGLSIVTLVKVADFNIKNNENYVSTKNDETPIVNNISSNNTIDNNNQSFPISFIFNFNYTYSQNNYLINDTFNINYADIGISNNTLNNLVFTKDGNDSVKENDKFGILKKLFQLSL